MATPTSPDTITTSNTVTALGASATTTATASKPGYRTSEFWLTVLAQLVALLFASGALADGSTAAKIAGLAASALSAAGYSVSRGNAKSGA